MNYRIFFLLSVIVASNYAADNSLEYASEYAENIALERASMHPQIPLYINILVFASMPNLIAKISNRTLKIPISKNTTLRALQATLRAIIGTGTLHKDEIKIDHLAPEITIFDLYESYKYDFDALEKSLIFTTGELANL